MMSSSFLLNGWRKRMKAKVVCFDLDDTLIREIHSVMLPCILNGKEKEHAIVQHKEEIGELDYKTADYLRANLLQGLDENKIEQHFLEIAKPLKNILETVNLLHNNKIQCVLITVGPIQVAKVAAELWHFDGYYGSQYEVIEGKFTGEITHYVSATHKVDCLMDFCHKQQIQLEECIAVGDGETDLPVYKKCGFSIALNASEAVKKKASYAIETDDLLDIIKWLI